MIYTFYSYKGGVGRSMALAAVAQALGLRGLKVLVVDFDLEAPGLERYFHGQEDSRRRRAEPGLIDLIAKYREALTDEAAFKRAEFQQLDRYQLPAIHTAGTRGGAVHLLSAGCREPADKLRNYALAVRNFDWQDFFYNWKGDRFFDWLRRRWLDGGDAAYDVVLVDSRTGVTEMGGVCAYQLADAVVLLSAPNWQNLEGTRDVARDFTSQSVLALRQGRPLQTLAVPARLALEHPRRADFLKDFSSEMGVLGMPKVLAEAGLNYERLAICFDSNLSVGEMTLGAAALPATASAFNDSIERLASALLLLADADGPLAQARREAALHVGAGGGAAIAPAKPVQADTAKASAGYDVFIDNDRTDSDLAHLLLDALEENGLRCFIDERDLGGGDKWQQQIELAVSYSANLAVLVGLAPPAERRLNLVATARRHRVRVVPVLLPGSSAPVLTAFGLGDTLAADLRHGVDGSGLAALLRILRAPATDQAPASSDGGTNSPYPGARAYAESDKTCFFGRDATVRELAAALRRHPVVVLEGPAQVGKSSLVAAGLLPWLRAGNTGIGLRNVTFIEAAAARWPTPQRRRDGARPDALSLVIVDHADSLTEAADAAAAADVAAATASAPLAGRSERLAALRERAGHDFRLMIVRRGVAPGFRRADDPPGEVVIDLAPMVRDALKRAVEEAARGAGQLLEPGLAERVIDGAGSARGAVAQVQRVMAQLWDERRRGWLTNQGLQGIGDCSGAFQRHLQLSLRALAPAWTQALHALLLAGVQLEPDGRLFPRPRPWAELATLAVFAAPKLVPEVVRDTFATLGLLDLWPDAQAGPMAAPVRPDVRDYFGDAWTDQMTGLLRWRQTNGTALQTWLAQGRKDADLLSERPLQDARDWLDTRPEWLLADEHSFIDSSVQRHVLAVPRSDTGAGVMQLEAVTGRDAVQLDLDGGPTLILHPDSARDLFAANNSSGGRGSSSGGAADPALSRVLAGAVLRQASVLSLASVEAAAFEQLAAAAEAPTRLLPLAALVAQAESRPQPQPQPQPQMQTHTPAPAPAPAAPGDADAAAPHLVLIHGTLVNTVNTFGALWRQHPSLWAQVLDHYGDGIFALEQATLLAGPVFNASTLALSLPPGTRLHLLTHGAGGLVAEVMVRAAAADWQELQSLRSPALTGMLRLAELIRDRGLRIERVVRVACPARGQLFTGGRLDAYLSVLFWSCQLAGGTLSDAVGRLRLHVARERLAPASVPGLAACLPDSELMRWLPATPEPVPGVLRVVAGRSGTQSSLSGWLNLLMADAYYQADNDFVVSTRSMFGGVPRSGGASFYLHQAPGNGGHHFGYFSDPACAQAIADALLLDDPPGFRPIGALSWAGDSPTGLR